jgi:predicted O-methyltransferase YrrM
MSWPAHRTPHYVWNRFKEWLWQRQNPDAPWLGPKAVAVLETLLQPYMQGIEFGAGRSTSWIARRVATLESWEESPQWREKVASQLAAAGLQNVTLSLVESGSDTGELAYTKVIATLANRIFDFVLVDADHAREQLCRQLVQQVQPGGFLMLDNANWYLPSASRSPNSRSVAQGPATAGWAEFLNAVAHWQCIWTSSGVTDTAFWIRNEA